MTFKVDARAIPICIANARFDMKEIALVQGNKDELGQSLKMYQDGTPFHKKILKS